MGGTGKAPATKIRSRSETLFFRVLALLGARGANSREGMLDAGRWTLDRTRIDMHATRSVGGGCRGDESWKPGDLET